MNSCWASNAEALSTWQTWQTGLCTYSNLACPVRDWGTGGLSGALSKGMRERHGNYGASSIPKSICCTHTELDSGVTVPSHPQW